MQYSIVLFVVISVLVSFVYGKNIKRSKRKHIVASGFLLGAAFIHAIVIVADACLKSGMYN